MPTVRQIQTFKVWLDSITDETVRAAISARIDRLRHGLRGDIGSVGDGIFELRIHLGAGWRIYYIEVEESLVLLLIGGTKKTQREDINAAKKIMARMKDRKKAITKAPEKKS